MQFKTDECNKDETFTVEDFKLLLSMAIGLWNLSLLSSQRIREVLGHIESEVYLSESKGMVNKMKHHSKHTPLMIVDADVEAFNGSDYPVVLELYKADVDYIEENIELTVNNIIEAIEFMIKYSPLGKREITEVA